jgi:hypothetical protein
MDNNGWAGRPGVPLNPDRDGWHWVESAEGPVPALWARPLWRHCRDFWDQRSPEWMEEQQWRYLRPCSPEDLSPAEVDARIAAAHKEWLAELNHDTDALMEAARQSALEEAAEEMDCACPQRGAVLAKLAKDGPLSHHWPCEKSDDCCALRGAAIRALKGEGND